MAKRGDIAKSRFLAWTMVYAADYLRGGSPMHAAITVGFERTCDEAEHGGIGIGRGTYRRARREAARWIDEASRTLGGRLIAEGC